VEPLSFVALNNANNTLTRSQMLQAHDCQQFLDAESNEINGLINMNTWKYCCIPTLPPGTQLINSVWSYQRKCTVDGHLLKHKVRLCADGQQQQYGIDFFESYTLVITWSTIQLVLLLSVLLNLHCCQVNFTQAFPQANIDVPIFLQMPAGWKHTDADGNDDYCLELVKNLYGTKQAAQGWFYTFVMDYSQKVFIKVPSILVCSYDLIAFSLFTWMTALFLDLQHNKFNL